MIFQISGDEKFLVNLTQERVCLWPGPPFRSIAWEIPRVPATVSEACEVGFSVLLRICNFHEGRSKVIFYSRETLFFPIDFRSHIQKSEGAEIRKNASSANTHQNMEFMRCLPEPLASEHGDYEIKRGKFMKIRRSVGFVKLWSSEGFEGSRQNLKQRRENRALHMLHDTSPKV
jgi:hypothetical protein